MTLLAQTNHDGSPSLQAAFVNALLIDALYRTDQSPWNTYAQISGARVAAFDSNPSTWPPDWGVLVLNDTALVAFGGTTNVSQWIGHCTSAFFPLIDTTNGNSVVGQFYLGLNVIEPAITEAIRTALRGTVYVTGHSYGAGAAKIFCDHLMSVQDPPEKLTLMTFGEPKSTGNFLRHAPKPYTHMRIVGSARPRTTHFPIVGLDPVTFTPPGILQLFKIPFIQGAPLGFLGLKWKHFGSAWILSKDKLESTDVYDDFRVTFDPTGWLAIVENLDFANLHFMEQTYLQRLLDQYLASQ